MYKLNLDDINRLSCLMEGGLLDRLLTNIKDNIALEIVGTEPSETIKREELYNTAESIKVLQSKLQQCMNESTIEEDNNVY